MLHGSETWALRVSDETKLERSDMRIVRYIYGAKLSDRISSAHLRERLGLEDLKLVLRKRRLRWFGHVERRDEEWIRKSLVMEVGGKRPRGRPKKSWMEIVESDMRNMGLKRQDALAWDEWRAGINGGGRRRPRYRLTRGDLDNGL